MPRSAVARLAGMERIAAGWPGAGQRSPRSFWRLAGFCDPVTITTRAVGNQQVDRLRKRSFFFFPPRGGGFFLSFSGGGGGPQGLLKRLGSVRLTRDGIWRCVVQCVWQNTFRASRQVKYGAPGWQNFKKTPLARARSDRRGSTSGSATSRSFVQVQRSDAANSRFCAFGQLFSPQSWIVCCLWRYRRQHVLAKLAKPWRGGKVRTGAWLLGAIEPVRHAQRWFSKRAMSKRP